MGIPRTPKKTERPPQINTEIRAQFLRKMSPMPVAIPKMERQIMNAVITSITVLTEGGSSGEVSGNLPSENPRNAMEVLRRKSKLARRAKTAEAMTAGEAFKELAIACLYTIPGSSGEEMGRRRCKGNLA